MDIKEITKGYQQEVAYQKKMLRNLQYWLQTCLTIAAIGFVLCYYYYHKTVGLFIVGVILLIIGVFGSLVIAYGRHRGKQNVNRVIADYQQKLNQLKQ